MYGIAIACLWQLGKDYFAYTLKKGSNLKSVSNICSRNHFEGMVKVKNVWGCKRNNPGLAELLLSKLKHKTEEHNYKIPPPLQRQILTWWYVYCLCMLDFDHLPAITQIISSKTSFKQPWWKYNFLQKKYV